MVVVLRRLVRQIILSQSILTEHLLLCIACLVIIEWRCLSRRWQLEILGEKRILREGGVWWDGVRQGCSLSSDEVGGGE